MSTSAIIMMVTALVIIWGGLILSIKRLFILTEAKNLMRASVYAIVCVHFYTLKRSKNLSNLSINTHCLFLYLTSEQTTAIH